MQHITYFQAVVLGLLQGVTELFPISSLGHSVLVPAWLGGAWTSLVTDQAKAQSPFLAFIVALHVATALALLLLFWRDWVGIVRGFFTSLRHRRIATTHERLAWLIILSTVPAGLLGLLLEHQLRTLFAKPLFAAVFLTLNGLILVAAERMRRRAPEHKPAPDAVDAEGPVPGLDLAMTQQVSARDASVIGLLQSGALLAGISRSGVTMAAGLLRGLTHEEAVRFSFLLATPIILAAGALKVPDLLGPLGDGIRAQSLAGAAAAFVAALAAATFLQRWFKTRTLTPFAIYCLVAGALSIVRFV